MLRIRLLVFITALLFPFSAGMAAAPFLLKDHPLHSMDALIISTMGYGNASVAYTAELASITLQQRSQRVSYLRLGCEPFSVLRDGVLIDEGYNCRSFFCAGYKTGTKMCRTADDKFYGGIVEINRRTSAPPEEDVEKAFTSFGEADRTMVMNVRIKELAALGCSPFYVFSWGVAVGEGYHCEEIGRYPYFSAKNRCVQDWRSGGDFVCETPLSQEQLKERGQIIRRFGSSSFTSSSAASSAGATGSGSSASASSVSSIIGFSDVVSGRYGYTAIMSLAQEGVIRGYLDGTFRPEQKINRAEFLKLLMSGLFPESVTDEKNCFPDVANQWYARYVCSAKRLGWVSGYEDGTFRASQGIRKAEGLKIVMASLGVPLDSTLQTLPIGVASGAWYTPSVRKAVELRILLEPSFDPSGWATRADAAVWMYRSKKVEPK